MERGEGLSIAFSSSSPRFQLSPGFYSRYANVDRFESACRFHSFLQLINACIQVRFAIHTNILHTLSTQHNHSPVIVLAMPKRSWNQISGATTQPARRTSTKTSAATRSDTINIKSGSPSSPDEPNLYRNDSFSEQHHHHPPTPTLTDAGSEPRTAKSAGGGVRQRAVSTAQSDDIEQIAWPSITRKVKACAACRKQKVCYIIQGSKMITMLTHFFSFTTQIKCDMDDDVPPCKRCKERGLSCKLNKSLQTLIDEESR